MTNINPQLKELKSLFKSTLYFDFKVKSNYELKQFINNEKLNKSDNSIKSNFSKLNSISNKIGNKDLILKIIGNSFSTLSTIPQDVLTEKLVKIPLKFLFKFKNCPGHNLIPVEILEINKISESEKKFRSIMIKSGLNRELNWKDNQNPEKKGIYEIENGTYLENSIIKKFGYLVAFGMTLAVFYSKKQE